MEDVYVLQCVITALRIYSQHLWWGGESEKQKQTEELQCLRTFHIIWKKVTEAIKNESEHHPTLDSAMLELAELVI